MPERTFAMENENHTELRHSDEVQDIITAVPSWIVRWGISLFFSVLLLIIGLSALVKYPDIVNAQLTVDSPDAPKPIVAKISGKLVKLLVTENQSVVKGQTLGYIESTANHAKVLAMLAKLKVIQRQVLQNKPFSSQLLNQGDNVQFGELQSAYQAFFQEYLEYESSINGGYLVQKRAYLVKDLNYLAQQQLQLKQQKLIQQKDSALAAREYQMHKKLEEERVETPEELRQEESKLLAKKAPLLQTEASIISGENSYESKQNDILELDNQMQQEKGKFLQALNSLISTAEDWKSKYVLTASQSGKVSFVGIVQENQVLTPAEEVFYVDPGDKSYFGEMLISQSNLGKVRAGQQVLVKLKSYPFEEFGMIKGRIQYISDIPYRDSVFISKVNLRLQKTSDLRMPIHLKQGMTADAEIITQNATILQRIGRSFVKIVNNNK